MRGRLLCGGKLVCVWASVGIPTRKADRTVDNRKTPVPFCQRMYGYVKDGSEGRRAKICYFT